MKGVLILSGGLDSTTLLYYLVKGLGWEVQALSFDYGQRHKKELTFAAISCNKLKVKHTIVNLASITSLISNSALTGNIEVPEGHYEQENMKLTVVPGRNTIMLAIAMGFAENLSYDFVSYANHQGDHAIYPDCRKSYVQAFDKVFEEATVGRIELLTPFSHISKREIAKLGLTLGINYDTDTWTCYKGLDVPCGKCGACCERSESLEYATNSTKS